MRAVILAGGLGSRLGAAGRTTPKALVEIAGRPVIEHVMTGFAAAGVRDFLIATGHLGGAVEQHFRAGFVGPGGRACSVRCVHTGAGTQTGGRLKRLVDHLRGEAFFLAYTDGLTDLDLNLLLGHHRINGGSATLAVVRAPPERFGLVNVEGARVSRFVEKPDVSDRWINAGFFVIEPSVLDDISGDATSFEYDVLPTLAAQGKLCAFRHEGAWKCMDTQAEVEALNAAAMAGEASWRRRA